MRAPIAAGVKVTVTVQLLDGANAAPLQVLALGLNSAELAPDMGKVRPVIEVLLKLVIVSVAVLGFAGVAGGPALAVVAAPSERAVVLKYTVSEAAPVRPTGSGVEPGLKETWIVSVRGLTAAEFVEGEYVTEIVQVAAAARVDAQVLD